MVLLSIIKMTNQPKTNKIMSTPKTPRKKNNSPLKSLIQNKILDLKIPKERKLVFLLTKEIYIDEIANGTKKIEYRTATDRLDQKLLINEHNPGDENICLVICCHSFKKYVLFECDEIFNQEYVNPENESELWSEESEIQIGKILDFGNF